jgi:hypothetical protein
MDEHFVILARIIKVKVMHESIPGVTIPPPRENTLEFDLIGYDSANAWVQGHN